jgi:hypothetical protein
MVPQRVLAQTSEIVHVFSVLIYLGYESREMSLNTKSLSNAARTVLLARIANQLTIGARDTYEVGTEAVLEPGVLRAYNELLHRVTDAVVQHLTGSQGYSLEDILEMLRSFGERHNRIGEMKWLIERAQKPIV